MYCSSIRCAIIFSAIADPAAASEGDDISRRARRSLWFLSGGCCGVRGLTGHAESAEGRVKEFNLLRHPVFGNCEIFRFKIGDGFALFVFDDHIKTYQV